MRGSVFTKNFNIESPRSKRNTEERDRFLDCLKSIGFSFKRLTSSPDKTTLRQSTNRRKASTNFVPFILLQISPAGTFISNNNLDVNEGGYSQEESKKSLPKSRSISKSKYKKEDILNKNKQIYNILKVFPVRNRNNSLIITSLVDFKIPEGHDKIARTGNAILINEKSLDIQSPLVQSISYMDPLQIKSKKTSIVPMVLSSKLSMKRLSGGEEELLPKITENNLKNHEKKWIIDSQGSKVKKSKSLHRNSKEVNIKNHQLLQTNNLAYFSQLFTEKSTEKIKIKESGRNSITETDYMRSIERKTNSGRLNFRISNPYTFKQKLTPYKKSRFQRTYHASADYKEPIITSNL